MDSYNKDVSKIAEKYSEMYRKHGYSQESLFMANGKQFERFDSKFNIGVQSGDSILDLGCGFGDMLAFAEYRKLDIIYTGIDISAEIIDEAKKRYPDNDFRVADILQNRLEEKWDWGFLIGALNIKLANHDTWQFSKDMISELFRVSKKGVAVDFLSSFVNYKEKGSFYADCNEVLSFAKSLSKRVSLKHDYLPYEFTIHIYKEDAVADNNSFVDYEDFPSIFQK